MNASQDEPKPSFIVGPLFVDTYLGQVTRGGIMLPFTATQFEAFLSLVERRGKVVLRKDFRPWSRGIIPGVRHPADDAVKELRKILGKDVPIKEVWGKGYRLGDGVLVTECSGPSVPLADRLGAIALDRMNVFTRESLLGSIQQYEEVLREEPDASAYVNLALNYINEGHTGFCLDVPQSTIPKARALLKQGLKYYPKFSSAYAIRGLTYAIYENDWTKAQADLDHAFDLNVNDEFAHMVAAHLDIARQHFDSGLEHARRAAELDWRTPMTIFTVPWMLVFAGRAEEGLQECRAALKIFDPFSVGHLICGYAWDALHIPEKAIKEYKRSLEIAEFPDAYGSLAYDYGLQGDREQAESCLKRLGEMKSLGYQSAYFEALFYAGLGEAAKAVQALEKAYAQKCDWLIYLNVEHRWDALREKAGFQAIVKRVGL